MNKVVILLLFFVFIPPLAAAPTEKEQIFYLKSGDKIKGTVLFENKDRYDLETSVGKVTLQKSDIQSDKIEVHLKNGDQIKGILLNQTDKIFRIETSFGTVTIKTEDINRLEFMPKTGFKPEAVKIDDRWYFSDEQLVDIWFDPTGFTLKNSELYFSALSWGAGITDRIQISSTWFNYFSGDFNIRPKFKIFEKGDISARQALSVGGHFHTDAQPDKYQFKSFKRKEFGYHDKATNQWVDKERIVSAKEWVKVGTNYDENRGYRDEGGKIWGEVFVAYTLSKLRAEGQGRISYTFGASFIYYPDTNIMPRLYAAVDIDILKNFKIMAEAFYDPYYLPMYRDERKDIDFPVFFDVGFITNKIFKDKKLWLGVHFQKPVIAVYYKF